MGYALALARAGADIFITYRTGDIEEIKNLIEAEGRRVVFYQGDLQDRDYLYSIPEKCLEAYGKIDILINNAGTNCFADFLDFPEEGWDRVMAVNLNAVYLLGHAVAKIMVKQGGENYKYRFCPLLYRRCQVSGLYNGKARCFRYNRSFANELGKYNIQCNAISPGFIYTDVNKAVSDDKDFYDHITGRISAGRWEPLKTLWVLPIFLSSGLGLFKRQRHKGRRRLCHGIIIYSNVIFTRAGSA